MPPGLRRPGYSRPRSTFGAATPRMNRLNETCRRTRTFARSVRGVRRAGFSNRLPTCGFGQLLSQQLVSAGERVLDVPPKLAARVRLLDTGQINKNDQNDARSVAVAALRAHDLPELAAEDHSMVMRVWARRYHDLGRL